MASILSSKFEMKFGAQAGKSPVLIIWTFNRTYHQFDDGAHAAKYHLSGWSRKKPCYRPVMELKYTSNVDRLLVSRETIYKYNGDSLLFI